MDEIPLSPRAIERGVLGVAFLAAIALGAAIPLKNPLLLLLGALPIVAAGVLAVLSQPTYLFWLLIFTAPLNDHFGIPVGPLMVRPYSLFTPLAVLLLLISFIRGTYPRCRSRLKWVMLPLLILSAFLANKLFANLLVYDFPPGMTRMFCLKMVIFGGLLGCLTIVVTAFAYSKQRVHGFVRFWIWLTHASLVLAFLQVVISNVTHWEIVHHRDVVPFGRPFSFFREPDVYASFLGSSFLLSLALYVEEEHSPVSRTLLVWTLELTALGLIVLFVRAAWLGTIAGLLLYAAYLWRKKKVRLLWRGVYKLMVATVLGLVTLTVLVPSAAQKLTDRFSSVAKPQGESASEYRMRELEAMYTHIFPREMGSDHLPKLLLGYGDFSWSYWAPIMLGRHYDQDADKNKGRAAVLIHPGFNMPLAVMHDNGAMGIALLLAFFSSLFFYGFKLINCGIRGEEEALMIGLLMAITCIFVCFIFSYDPITPFFWSLIGIYLAHVARMRFTLRSSR